MSNNRIPYGRQDINEDDIAAVVAALKSDFLTQGPEVPRFEQAVSQYCGAAHAVAVNSATSALHIACLALGLKAGDLLWTTPITFVASANCARYCGADVDFVDIDPVTSNLSPAALSKKLETAKKAGRLPKILVAVHLSGEPCDMQKLAALCAEYDVKIIEDASHAIGGRYGAGSIGNCAHSAITIFSFHPVKIVTSAEGGMAVTNDLELAEAMRLLRSHGITRDPAKMLNVPHGPWYYEQLILGFNYRMTDIQAALGTSQMTRLDQFMRRRHELADRYDELLADFPVVTPHRNKENYSGLHLYVIRVPDRAGKPGRDDVFARLQAAGIGVNLHYMPVHLQPYYRDHGQGNKSFPEAEAYYREAITLPLYPGLSDADQDRVVAALDAALA
ncbi:UDP-4-amino-4,6-dideoxy-N-acetyl-beta-L-altrosamine transaminase [Devosia sediminis]|uniref:UDP-4-amino-4, 6-dideoxy-N-acetyl-beta-L-altrosamine transaminase n=1 Tax=Devosia sediminis TaxID=2798801 RepID=A0A934IYG6_9HYPH|nr:UDP-4-amino-4,6-dideoxy-N-acetyl-beta-L-altrosamine transaminase [Devosia sediminis]MBJ3785053.1 UDP-4-amino-4,6-dideoxy-N-acetyl-beta-L-altrosamine transaminase [Devosia sediminis]